MSKKDLSLLPKNLKVIDADINDVKSWFYEEPKGFEIVVEIPSKNVKSDFVHIVITWQQILDAVKRYTK